MANYYHNDAIELADGRVLTFYEMSEEELAANDIVLVGPAKSEYNRLHPKQEEPTPVEETPIDDTLSDVLNPMPEFMQDEDVSEEKPQEETVVETAEPKMDEDEMVEELETYVPRSSNYSATEDDDGDDTDTGVNIDYDFRG